jgi:tetratricopeptide (TPR) repeat protein
MPKQQTDYLIQLIKSLTKTEKRQFRLWVNRNQANADVLFLQLFDFLDKQKKYDEELILKKNPGIKKRQISNLKAHLYKQLLVALRLQHRSANPDIEIRERFDYARILYNKGLYRQSLEILGKAKSLAKKSKLDALRLSILEFEKHIESQYITQSIDTRAEELAAESKKVSRRAVQKNALSNLGIQLYGLYLKIGYVRSEEEYLYVKEFFYSNLPEFEFGELSFFEKMYLYQSYGWYFFMTQDFLNYYKYAQKWVELFNAHPRMIEMEMPLYLKAMNSSLNALYLAQHHKKFSKGLKFLEETGEKYYQKKSVNVDSLLHIYLYLNRINLHYLEGTFSEGLKWVPKLKEKLNSNEYNWDDHRVMVFNYKIACMYFGSGDDETAIDYLNEIINQKSPDFREDIQCFARILCLIAHFNLGNDLLVEYQVKSVYRFLTKMKDLELVQKEILKFIRKIPRIKKENLKNEFIELRDNFLKLREAPFEKRPFLYLDIVSWLESKIEHRAIQDIIREKFLDREKPREDV